MKSNARGRVSFAKENRIWDLRSQGYDYDTISRIVNIAPSLTPILRRVRRRPPTSVDPIRRGRKRGFLSDDQVSDIKRRYANGQTQLEIGKIYDIDQTCVSKIVNGKTYVLPEYNNQSMYSFANRLTTRLL